MTPKQKRRQFLKRRQHNQPNKGCRSTKNVKYSHTGLVTWTAKRRVWSYHAFKVNQINCTAHEQQMGEFTS